MKHPSLYEIPVGASASVVKLNASSDIRRRLLDIGVVDGAKIQCLYASPSGDPVAYKIRGAVIALRKEDASTIEVDHVSEILFAPAKAVRRRLWA